MKRLLKSRMVVTLVLVAFLMASVQCGYIMHPERKGQTGGDIDVTILIFDCLWLAGFGVVGIVALVVDFSTGCIYEPGTDLSVAPGTKLAFNLKEPAPAEANLAVTVEKAEGEIVATLLDRDFQKGETVDREIMIDLPADLDAQDCILKLKVNGKTQATWNIENVEL